MGMLSTQAETEILKLRSDPLPKASRWHAYVFAACTGASIGFSRSPNALGNYEYIVEKCGVIFFFATLVFVMLATTADPIRRANRLSRCAIIALVAAAFTELARLDIQLPLIPEGFKFDRLNAIAVLLAASSFYRTYSARQSLRHLEMWVPNWLASASTTLLAIVSLIVH
jgi:hypothetical protein